jgi:hypothetical protein
MNLVPAARSRIFLAISVFAPLGLYWYTAAPGVTGTDSGELALACRTLGIAHPPGFPLYVLLGHLFSMLPLSGDIARRLNLFSAVCAALACGITFLLCRDLLQQAAERPELKVKRQKPKGKSQKSEPAPSFLVPDAAALAAALAFGFSLSLWSWAVLTEVYTLNILLVALMLWLAARGSWRGAALAAGLALGVHHATVVMAMPAAAWLLWSRRRPSPREMPGIAAMLALGLCSYLYLPLRASKSPVFNWGDPRNLERFWWQISAKQYRVHLFEAPLDQLVSNVLYFFRLWVKQFTPAGFLLLGAGLLGLVRRNRRLFWFTALLMVLNVGFTVNYDIAEDIEGYYLPAFLAGAWCLAFGAQIFVDLVAPKWQKLATAAVFAAALSPAVMHFPANNRHNDRSAPQYVDSILRGVPAGSVVLTSDWQFYSPWLYRRHLEGLRPDLAVVDTLMMRRSWYLDMLARDYPDLAQSAGEELTAFRRQLDLFEHDQPYDPAEIDGTFVALVRKLAAARPRAFQTQKIERSFAAVPVLPLSR